VDVAEIMATMSRNRIPSRPLSATKAVMLAAVLFMVIPSF